MSDVPTVGYVYFITNPSYRENIYKVGMTTEVPNRMSSLFTTGVPEPFIIKYLVKFRNNEYTRVESYIHRIFGPQRINGRREFFNITEDQVSAIVELIKDKGELVDPSEYNQLQVTSRRKKRRIIIISQGDKVWFVELLDSLIETDDRERVQTMSQDQQNAYTRDSTLNEIIVGLGDNLDDFKRAIDKLDNTSVTNYCNSLLVEIKNTYSRAFVNLIKYHYQ